MIVAEQLATEPGSRPAVHDVTFVVRRGEVFGLHGGRGDGVSLVLQLVAGNETPARGRVTVDGLDPVVDRQQLDGRLLLVGPVGPTDELAGTGPVLTAVEVLLLDRPAVTDSMVTRGRTLIVASPDTDLLRRCCHRGISLRSGRVTRRWSADGPPARF